MGVNYKDRSDLLVAIKDIWKSMINIELGGLNGEITEMDKYKILFNVRRGINSVFEPEDIWIIEEQLSDEFDVRKYHEAILNLGFLCRTILSKGGLLKNLEQDLDNSSLTPKYQKLWKFEGMDKEWEKVKEFSCRVVRSEVLCNKNQILK